MPSFHSCSFRGSEYWLYKEASAPEHLSLSHLLASATATSVSWGCLYLERHNFKIAPTNTIDGGVFVVSGQTSAHRSEIRTHHSLIHGSLHEYTFSSPVGPLPADNDNFVPRWTVNHGWKIEIEYAKDASIKTTLGLFPKFPHQHVRPGTDNTTHQSQKPDVPADPANAATVPLRRVHKSHPHLQPRTAPRRRTTTPNLHNGTTPQSPPHRNKAPLVPRPHASNPIKRTP